MYEQQIRFCTSADGVRLAYAITGNGAPFVKASNWLSHLEHDWNSPVWAHWLKELSRYHTLVRYDSRGCGLSDWDIREYSLEAWVSDLEAVVETTQVDRFPLLGISQGGPIAITYATRHPEKVSRLILYGTYARGLLHRNISQTDLDERELFLNLIRIGWGKEHPAFRQVFTTLFLPEGTPEQFRMFNELQRVSSTPENAALMIDAFHHLDVSDIAKKINVPTLVLHAKNDLRIPFEEGRLLASMIPGARFVPLEGKNHILLAHEPAWTRFLLEMRSFLGIEEKPSTVTLFPTVATSPTQKIGNYELMEKLGEGGMGVIYKARDTRLQRTVVLKLLSELRQKEEDMLRRFIQEARAAASLDHPNICTIYEIEESLEGKLFIAMPFYEGETLKEIIARGPLPLHKVVDYAQQVAEGLAHAHAAGIVHRDIKPANLFITTQGRLKILDFGIAKLPDVTMTQTGVVVGTLAYMSPEQASGQSVDYRTDLWALGVVMYEMLSGQRPFSGVSAGDCIRSIVHDLPRPVTELRADTPAALAGLVDQLMEKDASQRSITAQELAASLKSILP